MTDRIYYIYEDLDSETLGDALEGVVQTFETRGHTVEDGNEEVYLGHGEVGAAMYPVSGTDSPRQDGVPDVPHLRQRFSEYDLFKHPFDNKELQNVGDAFRERLSEAVELVVETYLALEPAPTVVYGLTSNDWQAIVEIDGHGLPVTEESLAERRFGHIPWLVIAPPPFVETYGRSTLLDTPAWKTRELDDGSVLVVSYADIFYQSDNDIDSRHEHLGMDSPIAHLL